MSSHAALVFASVFPQAAVVHSVPTPQATPELSFVTPGQPFGGFAAAPTHSGSSRHIDAAGPATTKERSSSTAEDAVRRNIAWSVATRFLALRGTSLKQGNAQHASKRRPADVQQALDLLLNNGSAEQRNELLQWYEDEVKQHFHELGGAVEAPGISLNPGDGAFKYMESHLGHLSAMSKLYLTPFRNHIESILKPDSSTHLGEPIWTFDRSLQTLFTQFLERSRFGLVLTALLRNIGQALFDMDDGKRHSRPTQDLSPDAAFQQLQHMLIQFKSLGCGSEVAHHALAVAVDRLIDDFVASWHMRVDWFEQKSVVPKLQRWIETGLSRFIQEILGCLDTEPSAESTAHLTVSQNDIKQWRDMAVTRLGHSRVANLFDHARAWDRSLGAIRDLKEFITMPGARVYLSSKFTQQLHRRLLHAGATTVQILDMYIYVIRTFSELDPKGVLLDRVARPIRRYLKERDDTTRVIIASLLTDVNEISESVEARQDVSIEIGKEMLGPLRTDAQDNHDTDWDNMDWTPDPHDAGPDYRRSRIEDVPSSLLSLYDKEDFAEELKNILGAHLIQATTAARSGDETAFSLDKEIRLLELFKARLGDDKLQPCEVMLHDVDESSHIDGAIQRGQLFADMKQETLQHAGMDELGLNAQIVSAFFWPPLRDESFHVPEPITKLQQAYEKSFTELKDMRKLQWMDGLGRTEVELEFEDRSVNVTCSTAQASVIYAFNDESASGDGSSSVQHTVDELSEKLEMDEGLLRQCLAFWQSQLVLRETDPGSDTFCVLETLPAQGAGDAGDSVLDPYAQLPPQLAAGGPAAAAAAIKSPEDMLLENMQMYRQFVLGMLTNQGRMDVGRVHMMLKMVAPGGFPFAPAELARLMERMEAEGLLVREDGDVWVVAK